MSGFSGAWLSLREPVDSRSRSPALVAKLVQALRGIDSLRVIDLGTGLGSNLRFLAPPLATAGIRQHWTLVDHDDALLGALPASIRAHAATAALAARGALRLEPLRLDLARELPSFGDGPVLVTAAALLDLVSGDWLERFAAACANAGATVHVALSYDGLATFTPVDAHDAWMHAELDRHQHGDKGFGAALGPDASRRAREAFAAHAYHVDVATSDWVLDAHDADLQRQLLEGWAAAARELHADDIPRIDGWLARRLAHVDHGVSRLTIGHEDLLALPGDFPRRSQSNSTSPPST